MDALEAGGSSCHDCTLKYKVVVNKEALDVRKEKEATEAKKQLVNQRKVVKSMKQNYEKAIDETNELKTKMGEQNAYIKQLEELCQTNDEDDKEDEVQEVGLVRNLMSKNKSGHLCVTCDQRFAKNNGLEKHILDKHTELWCDYCGIMCRNKNELKQHMEQCQERGMEAIECDKCSKKLVRWGTKNHKCQPLKKLISCTVCERVFKTDNDVKKHVANEHKQNQDKSNIVCRHYRNGNCDRGDRFEYSHVGFVRNSSKSKPTSPTRKKASICRHGDACSWLARGVCGFFHCGGGVQKPHQNTSQQTPQETRQPRLTQQRLQPQQQRNKDDASCPNGLTCIHLARGSCNYGGIHNMP